jgi:hypothetical protein
MAPSGMAFVRIMGEVPASPCVAGMSAIPPVNFLFHASSIMDIPNNTPHAAGFPRASAIMPSIAIIFSIIIILALALSVVS